MSLCIDARPVTIRFSLQVSDGVANLKPLHR
jgi:hypothetical protein